MPDTVPLTVNREVIKQTTDSELTFWGKKLSHSLLRTVNNFRDKIHDEKKGKGIQNDGVWERAVAGYVKSSLGRSEVVTTEVKSLNRVRLFATLWTGALPGCSIHGILSYTEQRYE